MNPRQILSLAGAALLCAALAGCPKQGQFSLTSDDNNPDKLAAAFALMEKPGPAIVNSTGQPLAFLVARGKPNSLIAYDLAAQKELWRAVAGVESKVVVGRDFVAHRAGDNFVGRDVKTGKELWKHPLGGTFIGAAADRQHVYVTTEINNKLFRLTALTGSTGAAMWSIDAPGVLGAPAAMGGLVFSPFLNQWLAILDAATGKQVTRIRGLDEQISFVRTDHDRVYFGSDAGVFLLDKRAASGTRAQSTYGRVKLPKEFVRVHYHWNAYDPVQSGYSAYDRNRILWHASAAGEKLAFDNNRAVVHTYRFLFGFDVVTEKLEWAYSYPRVDLIATDDVGSSIVFASMLGGLGAVDANTGAKVFEAKIDAQLIGGTFDADGWKPQGHSTTNRPTTGAALLAIANDRDARFNEVKKFAVSQLATLEGPDVTRDLLVLIKDERTPPYLYETSVKVLIDRADPAGVVYLVDVLEGRYDYVEQKKPRAVGVAARALAAIEAGKLGESDRKKAVRELSYHLTAPETEAADLDHVLMALSRHAKAGELTVVRSFLLMYRADVGAVGQLSALSAAVDTLLSSGSASHRETVAFVAEDPTTDKSVAAYARRALATASKAAHSN